MGQRILVESVYLGVGGVVAIVTCLAYVQLARIIRLALVRAVIGLGPLRLRTRFLGVPLRLHLVPLASHVVPWPPMTDEDRREGEAAGLAARVEQGELRGYPDLDLPARIAFVFLPLLVTLALAVAANGAALPGRLIGALHAVLLGALSPFETGAAALLAIPAVLALLALSASWVLAFVAWVARG